jgi:hypothetical protein
MICLTCLHSVSQTFTNGEITSSILFCNVLMRDVKGNLVKCGGYEGVVKIIPTAEVVPVAESYEDAGLGNQDVIIEKPLTQSERMKEYWRNRKGKKG